MTRLINIGVETGDTSEFSTYTGGVTVSTTAYTGGYSLYIPDNNYARVGIPTPGDVLYMSIFRYLVPLTNTNIFVFYDIALNQLCEIQATSGGLAIASRNGTTLATSASQCIFSSTWQHYEWYVYIADSGGRSVLKIDGATVIDYTGDTKPSTNTDIYTFGAMGFSGMGSLIDDLIINDDGGSSPDNTYPGRIRLFPLRPNGVGNYTQWDPSTGNNYDCVNEVPASSSDYVYTTVDDEIDSYTLDNLSGIPGGATYKSVIVVAKALIDSGSKKLALGVRSGSTDSFGADKNIGVSYLPYYERFITDPADAGAWTEPDINALEIAIKSRA